MFFECSRWISETPRYGFKFVNIKLTMNEFVVCVMIGVGTWLGLDASGILLPLWWGWLWPMPIGLFTAATAMALLGSLSRGKPGSYLWDFAARFGLAGGGRGAIVRSKPYVCDAHEFVSKYGIWGSGRDHVGPRKPRHMFTPPSRLGGRFCNMVPADNCHVSLCDVFGGEPRSPGMDHGPTS